MLVCQPAAAQQSEGNDTALQEQDTVVAAHKFIHEALLRAETEYGGVHRPVGAGILLELPRNVNRPVKFSRYGGEACQATFVFDQWSLAVDWSQIIDIKGGQGGLTLTGRFAGSAKVATHDFDLNSSDLSQRVASAASALQKACDPLKSLGF